VISDGAVRGSIVFLNSMFEHTMLRQQNAGAGGEFRFSGLNAGDYELILEDRAGKVLIDEFMYLSSGASSVELRVPAAAAASFENPVVTFASLRHRAPDKAEQEVKAAKRATLEGDTEGSIAHLLRATAIDPAYLRTHNDLAARYIDCNRYDAALSELERAVALDPAAAYVQFNLAVCLSRLNRLAEAEAAARRAIQLDSSSPKSHFVLGVVLVRQGKLTSETADHLSQAGAMFPSARLKAAEILADNGQKGEAAKQLRGFLKTCVGGDCLSAKGWLAQLTSEGEKSQSGSR
jgi:tetratricopeptide (TPR) repeat protein